MPLSRLWRLPSRAHAPAFPCGSDSTIPGKQRPEPSYHRYPSWREALILLRPRVAVVALEAQDQVAREGAPPRLMRGPEPLASVAVEVFVEQDAIGEGGVGLEEVVFAVHGASPIRAALEDADEARGDLLGGLAQAPRALAADGRDRE